jgi:ribosomal protein S18 acetylase RimI-like enzyme
MIQFRPIVSSDLEPLRQIFNAIISEGEAFTYDAPFSLDEMKQYVDSYTAGGFVATLDGIVVGAYVLRPNHPGRGSHVCNATYVVDARVRGQQISRQLGEHSLARAKELGFDAMQFNAVVSTNTPAVKLWRGLGFQILATIPDAFRRADGSRAALFIMHRML